MNTWMVAHLAEFVGRLRLVLAWLKAVLSRIRNRGTFASVRSARRTHVEVIGRVTLVHLQANGDVCIRLSGPVAHVRTLRHVGSTIIPSLPRRGSDDVGARERN
jgi:hypothetical protein